MRIRLVHKQALLLVSSVLLTVVAMGSLTAWNLRDGFSEYLAGRDIERLEQFADLVAMTAEKYGGVEKMEASGTNLHDLLHEFAKIHGASPIRALKDVLPGKQLNAALGFKPPPRPIDSIDAFKDRIAVYHADGHPILGTPSLSQSAQTIDRPVTLGNSVVAFVRMAKLKPVPNEVEYRFLAIQYKSTLAVSFLLLVTALMLALWISKQWVKPLIEIQGASELIAKGKLQTRLKTNRTDEIGDAMANINSMASSLEILEQTKRQWLADISHELRTPLTILRGEIDGLIEGVIDYSPAAMNSLREEVLKLNSLVNDLHLLALSDLQVLPCYFEELNLKKLISQIVDRFQRQAATKDIHLNVQFIEIEELQVRWDSRRIDQLVGNLIDNSLRHTDSPGKVFVTVQLKNPFAVSIDINDTAPGVSENDLKHLFDPLFRADTSRSKRTGGSGLGLSICQQITNSHHGLLTASHSELGGISMHLELPIDGDATT